MNGPVLSFASVRRDRTISELDRHASIERDVVEKEALDVLALVSERDMKVRKPVPRVVPHDMPKNRVTADVDHRLGNHIGLFGEARAEPACENRDLHEAPSCFSQ